MLLGKSASRSPLGWRSYETLLHPSFAELPQTIPMRLEYVNGKLGLLKTLPIFPCYENRTSKRTDIPKAVDSGKVPGNVEWFHLSIDLFLKARHVNQPSPADSSIQSSSATR
jgi:hypothetical protein